MWAARAQVFKIALDYWNFFVPDVYASVSTGMADANAQFAFGGAPGAQSAGRRQLYAGVLSKLRRLMITRMAQPEEARAPAWTAPCMLHPQKPALLRACAP